MSHFEFLMTIASVVLAIGLSELFAGWGRLVRSGTRIKWSGLWIAWSIYIVILHFMYWSGIWPYRDVTFDSGFKILWLAIPTFFIIVISYLFSPDPGDLEELDLEALYWRIMPRAVPMLMCVYIMSTLADRVLIGEASSVLVNVTVLREATMLSFAGIILIPFVRMRWFHWVVWLLCFTFPVAWMFAGPKQL
jgi:hypothetical protein